MTKTDNGAEYPSSAYAYVPDAQQPSTWKIRLWETPEAKVTVAQLGRAAAAMSSGGFRGEQAEIPEADVAKVKARIRGEYSKLGVKPADVPESVAASEPTFMVDISEIALSANDEATARVPLAIVGTFHKGAQKFTISRKDVATMAANFKKRGNGEVVLDYEHASEFPEVAAGGPIPAAGWIVSVDAEPDAKGIVWGDLKFTAKARDLIDKKEYKYISPVINWGARDRSTGDPQGATLRSAALTNTPVLDRMPAITLSDAGWQALSTQGETPNVAKEPVMCSEHPKTPMLCPQCDKDAISKLSASEHQHQAPRVIRLTDVTRDAEGRLNMASIPADASVSIEVVRALDAQRIALSEVDAAISKGKIKPAAKAHWTKIALSDIETFRELTKDMQQVDLSEHGHGGAGSAASPRAELLQIEGQLREKATALMKADKIPYHQAFKIACSENGDLLRRRSALNRELMSVGAVDEEGEN